jgi:hypothetical protein
MVCAVCNDAWPEGTRSCHCGYDFTTRDPALAIARFRREARYGNRVWRRGLVALVFLPVTLAIGSLPTGMMLAMGQLGLALIWIVQGLVRADIANKKLSAAKQLIQLPTARLLR